jgi:uncharacterized protein
MVAREGGGGWLRRHGGDLRIALKVTPGARTSGVVGVEVDAAGESRLAVRVAAPPAEGRANAAVVKLLARRWGLAPRDLELVSGAAGRRKVIQVQGATADLAARIAALEGQGPPGEVR